MIDKETRTIVTKRFISIDSRQVRPDTDRSHFAIIQGYFTRTSIQHVAVKALKTRLSFRLNHAQRLLHAHTTLDSVACGAEIMTVDDAWSEEHPKRQSHGNDGRGPDAGENLELIVAKNGPPTFRQQP